VNKKKGRGRPRTDIERFASSAHNGYGRLGRPDKLAPEDDYGFYVQSRADMCGRAAVVDHYGEADKLPLPADSRDYIIRSHVVEHLPDPISAFFEWSRVLKGGGTIFMIFPKRDALPADRGRAVSTIEEFELARELGYTVDDMPKSRTDAAGGRRGHYWVFTLESMIALIHWCNAVHGLDWEFVHTEETDAKVGNGHTVVCRFVPSERPVKVYGTSIVDDIKALAEKADNAFGFDDSLDLMIAVGPEVIDEVVAANADDIKALAEKAAKPAPKKRAPRKPAAK